MLTSRTPSTCPAVNTGSNMFPWYVGADIFRNRPMVGMAAIKSRAADDFGALEWTLKSPSPSVQCHAQARKLLGRMVDGTLLPCLSFPYPQTFLNTALTSLLPRARDELQAACDGLEPVPNQQLNLQVCQVCNTH